MRYIASCSFGKDSLAMILRLIAEDMPLDEIVFYDTGMEFEAIYNNLNKLKSILANKNIKMAILKPAVDFCYKAFDMPVKNRDGSGYHYGYSWCGGCCRWGTTDKLRQIDKYCESEPTIVYVGIASDEHKRIIKERKPYKRFPLVEWNMTERDCLKYCYENGWNWKEQSSNVPLGYIDLYDILDRVSCWCCSNKNKKELINIYKYLPQYWQKLKDFQSRTDRPMKKFVKEGKSYGNINEMEKVFEEIIQKKY